MVSVTENIDQLPLIMVPRHNDVSGWEWGCVFEVVLLWSSVTSPTCSFMGFDGAWHVLVKDDLA